MSYFNMEETHGNASKYWNFGKPKEDGFRMSLEGDVVEMVESQQTEFGTGKPVFMDEVEPGKWAKTTEPKTSNAREIIDLIFVIRTDDIGEVSWRVKTGSRTKPSLAVQALKAALGGKANFEMLAGQRIKVDYLGKSGNANDFEVHVLGNGTNEFRGIRLWEEAQGFTAPAARTRIPSDEEVANRPVSAEQTQEYVRQARAAISGSQGAGHAEPNGGQDEQPPLSIYDDVPF